jgi:hypothetical protein
MAPQTHALTLHKEVRTASRREPLLFRSLYVLGLLVTLPIVAATRLLPSRRLAVRDSIFAETSCAVLTALDIGFMA